MAKDLLVKEQLEKKVPPEKPEKKKETPMEFISSMAVVLVTGLFIITFNLQAFEIPSSSMEKTLLIGDHVFVDRITLAPSTSWMPVVRYRDIHRGDIVVFLSPETPGLYVVKRIIGVPGDRIHLRNGVVYVNGVEQKELYVFRSMGNYDPYRDDFPAVPAYQSGTQVATGWPLLVGTLKKGDDLVIPPDSYFGMGDNRDRSYDSRYWGFIPKENVIGRPLFIYWSFETPENQYQQTELSERAKFIGHIIIHFFDQTRWSRMLRLVH
ncbi:MAG TPA: signal peptidase I [Terriglobales bacterium]